VCCCAPHSGKATVLLVESKRNKFSFEKGECDLSAKNFKFHGTIRRESFGPK
jgi:hypothetical protein